jgi:hypothetical protein
MLERDTDLLDSLLSDTYTLTHKTGYMQSKTEWLQQVDSGEMRYHSAQEQSTDIVVDGDNAFVVGRSRVDAPIHPGRPRDVEPAADDRVRAARRLVARDANRRHHVLTLHYRLLRLAASVDGVRTPALDHAARTRQGAVRAWRSLRCLCCCVGVPQEAVIAAS